MRYLLTNTEISRATLQQMQRLENSRSVWKQTRIIKLNQWLIESYLADQPDQFVINSLESWLIWLQIILEQDNGLTRIDQVMQCEYLYNLNHAIVASDPTICNEAVYQSTPYGNINKRYLDFCQDQGLIDCSTIACQLHINKIQPLAINTEFITESNPYNLCYQRWNNFNSIKKSNKKCYHKLSESESDELTSMINWCNYQATTSHFPVTIICPDDHDVIYKIKSFVCANLNAGFTFSDLTIAGNRMLITSKTIITLLSLNSKSPIDELLLLFNSHYLDLKITTSDYHLLQSLRNYATTIVDCLSIIDQKDLSPSLSNVLRRITQALDHKMRNQTINEWSIYFMRLLNTFDWTKTVPIAFSIKLRDLLKQLHQQPFLKSAIDQSTAILIIQNRIKQASFFKEEQVNTNIHLLTAKQAIHCKYVHVWVYGCHNYFYPRCLSNQLSQTKELRLSLPTASDIQDKLFQHLCQHTQSVVFSSCQLYNGQDVQIDPFLLELEPMVDHSPPTPRQANPMINSNYINKSIPSKHGHQLLLDQSHCSFRAYAKHQLNLKPTITHLHPYAIDALDKGQTIHTILHQFWKVTLDHKTLICRLPHEEEELLDLLIKTQIKQFEVSHKIRHQILSEQYRVKTLILQWLAFEKKREPFTVFRLEYPIQLKVKQLNIKLVIDRIDRLADGSLMVIDYKTYKPHRVTWTGQRLPDLQLPLYALACRTLGDLSGVCFAHVHHSGCCFNGFSSSLTSPGLVHPKTLSKSSQPIEALLNDWEHYCEMIIEEYLVSKPIARPHFHDSCQYCEFHSSCGILNDFGQHNDD